MGSIDRDGCVALAARWATQAFDLDHAAHRGGSGYSTVEKKVLAAQANVYRACAAELRREAVKVRRGR